MYGLQKYRIVSSPTASWGAPCSVLLSSLKVWKQIFTRALQKQF